MTTEVVIPYYPRRLQRQLHFALNQKRWGVVVCHRRFGKTVWAINHLLKSAVTCPLEAPRFAYFAPFLNQAKAIAWDYLQKYAGAIPGTQFNQSELRADLPNGARIRLLGADNPDSQRGVYLDGVILDESAQMPPSLFSEILRPALSDRKGWCVWMGTPHGRNHFFDRYEDARLDDSYHVALYKASETGIIDEDELADAKASMGDDAYEQEYECSWQSALKGAYFNTELAQARAEHRITHVTHDKAMLVDTWWDLGMDDSTAIWFTQDCGREVHAINYFEATGEGFAFYQDVLERLAKEHGYRYRRHYAPHDIAVRELGTGKSRIETAADLGINFEIVERVQHKADAIQAARNMIDKVWFDEHRCNRGIVCLESYRKEWDDRLQTFRDKPLHDWASHAADAFMTLARGHEFRNATAKPMRKVSALCV